MPTILSRKPGGSGGGGAPSGPAGGDLGGSYPNPEVDVVDNDILGSGTPGATTYLRGDRAWVEPPGTQLAYVEFTNSVSITSTTEATPVDVVSSGAVVYAATRICIEFFCVRLLSPDNTSQILNLWDDTTDLGRIGTFTTPDVSAGSGGAPIYLRRFLTPTAATHTYKIRGWRGTGSNGTVDAGAGGGGTNFPGYIRVTIA